jgi:DNA-binding MarR family transcriptional regulator
MTVGELTLRGCYLGSNVSYNVKKMVENGYLAQQRSLHDRRSIHVRLTEKGIKLRGNLSAMHVRAGSAIARRSRDNLPSPRPVSEARFGRGAETARRAPLLPKVAARDRLAAV